MSLSSTEVQQLAAIVAKLEADPQQLHAPELAAFRQYLATLGAALPAKAAPKPAKGPVVEEVLDDEDEEDSEKWAADSEDEYAAPKAVAEPTDDQLEAAVGLKGQAADAVSEGDLGKAIAFMTEALAAKSGSAMYWAYRSQLYLNFKKANAAIKDATAALEINPENARALRVRGTALRHQCKWELAAADLNASQKCDYDENTAVLAKMVTDKANEIKHERRMREVAAEDDKVRRQKELHAQRVREQQEEAEKKAEEAKAQAGMGGMPGGMPDMSGMGGMGGMPGMGGMGGMPGGMPGMGGMGGGGGGGMPDMAGLMSDPDVAEALKDPAVAAKLQQAMANPAMAMQLMMDPQMAPLMQKLMAKMGGGGGMPGMGGMGGMGGAGGHADPSQAFEDVDIDDDVPAPKATGHPADDLD